MSQTALEGLKVLDLSTYVAGPYCTRLLAGLGAEVLKVEPPAGDPARQLGPFLANVPQPNHSALFQHLNAAKKSIVLDVESTHDRSTIRRLALQSQVVVESFGPGRMAQWGLDHSSLCHDNPTLITVSISDFGQNGPWCDWRATELTHLALGGMLFTSGEPDRPPLALAGHQASYLTGLHAAVATLAAWFSAERTGQGRYLDVSIIESLVSVLEATTVSYEHDGLIRRRQGNRHGRDHPMTILPCKDGHIGLMIGGDANWDLLVAVSGLAQLADPEFGTPAQRFARADKIDAILRPWLMAHTRSELFHFGQELRLPFAMVLSPEEVLRDAQHRRREFFNVIEDQVVGQLTTVGAPFRMKKTPWKAGRAPSLGEHGPAVLASLDGGEEGPLATAGWVTRTDPAREQCQTDRPGTILADIRVVDLTTMWAGPYCTRLLADLGAEVIKIESPRRVDGTRSNPGYFEWLNRNKLSVTLDLNSPQGKESFRRLVKVSDVVVENFSPRVMANFGLSYAALRPTKTDLIMLSMPAYGSTGPYRHYVAYGPGIEAMSGLSFLTGYPDGPPMLSGSACGDPVAGLHGAVAVLAALRHRRVSGQGQWIDLSQLESLSQLLGEFLVSAAARGDTPVRQGNRHPTMCPHGVYRCAGDDNWVAIAVTDEEDWHRLCQALGQESLATDSRYASMAARKNHEDEVDLVIESWTQQRDKFEVTRVLQAAGIAAGAVLDGRCLAQSEHLTARGFFLSLSSADGSPHHYPGLPWKMAGHYNTPDRPAPRLGQHNAKILGRLLGFTESEMRQLEMDGVISYELQDDSV